MELVRCYEQLRSSGLRNPPPIILLPGSSLLMLKSNWSELPTCCGADRDERRCSHRRCWHLPADAATTALLPGMITPFSDWPTGAANVDVVAVNTERKLVAGVPYPPQAPSRVRVLHTTSQSRSKIGSQDHPYSVDTVETSHNRPESRSSYFQLSSPGLVRERRVPGLPHGGPTSSNPIIGIFAPRRLDRQ